jgi:hypothetical protein
VGIDVCGVVEHDVETHHQHPLHVMVCEGSIHVAITLAGDDERFLHRNVIICCVGKSNEHGFGEKKFEQTQSSGTARNMQGST